MTDGIQSGGVFMEQQGADGLLLVQSYGNGGFRIGGRRIDGSVLLVGDSVYSVEAQSTVDLKETDFDKLLSADEKPEILFVGTGSTMQQLPKNIRHFLQTADFMPELMDTGAAARTLNVLRMEDRRVAALLLQVE